QTPISDIRDRPLGTYVDVCGIIMCCDDMDWVTARVSGKAAARRSITIVDKSTRSINVTVWDTWAQRNWRRGEVIRIKNARITDRGERLLIMENNSILEVNRPGSAVRDPGLMAVGNPH
ncbi:60S acidic ribosomal protein P1, partial [Perkinsus olseni]